MKKRFEIEQWYEAVECECGGIYIEGGDVIAATIPPQREYKCNNCEKKQWLYKPDWPGVKMKIVGIG